MQQDALFSAEAIQPSGEQALSVWRERAYACQGCSAAAGRKQVVFGSGNSSKPDILFIGEAPRSQEEQENLPFAGNNRTMLQRMIDRMGLKPGRAYFCNVVCCCSTEPDGAPSDASIDACQGLLLGQLRTVQPRVIVTLGNIATETLLRKKKPLLEMRGKWWEWQGVPVRPTFHPNYLLRAPKDRASALVDLDAAMNKLRDMDRPPEHKAKPKAL